MTLPARVEDWPTEWRYRYLERLAIMLDTDERFPPKLREMERKAEEDTRRQAEADETPHFRTAQLFS